MSEETVEIVRRNYEIAKSIGRTGPEFVDPEEVAPEFWARLAPDVELHERWEPQELTDLGHAVVVDARVVAVGRGNDVPIEMDETDVFWFRDGMLVRLQGFATRAEALEAMAHAS
jgi:hypothetical protein